MADDIHHVDFVDVKESYPLGSAIQCRYTTKESLARSNRDWIGIYRVGWRCYDNYETYVWVQLPATSDDSKELDSGGNVTFPADGLPKDSIDFYQFCYVSSANQVCGVSSPFQLCSSMDNLFEVQDPDDPTIMVIKTRSQMLEEQITALKNERLDLQKETQLLHLELDAERASRGQLMTQLQRLPELQNRLDEEISGNTLLHGQIKELQDTLQTERQSNEQLHKQIKGMRDELMVEIKAHKSQDLEDLEQENNDAATRFEAQTATDVSDAIKTSLRISDSDEGDDRTEATLVTDSDRAEVTVVTDSDQAEVTVVTDSDRAEATLTTDSDQAEPTLVTDSDQVEATLMTDSDLAGATFVTDSTEDDSESKQMSFTERITGSVLKHLKRASDWLAEDFDDEQAYGAESEHPTLVDKAEPSLTLCPVCHMDFLNVSDNEIATHIDGHNGPVCPFCYMQFDKNYEENVVTAHVNSHLDNQDGLLSF